MNKKSSSKQSLWEFIRYLIIGFSTTFLNWGITAAFIELTKLEDTAIGNTIIGAIAWTVSTVFFAFWTYKLFVFRSRSMEKRTLWREFSTFTGARLFTLGVELLMLLVFCDILGFDKTIKVEITRAVKDGFCFDIGIRENYIVKLGACVITTVLNYIFSKLLVFKKGQKMSRLEEAEQDEGESFVDAQD